MSIPKNIFQTFKTADLPFITRFYIRRFRKKNPDWNYEFFDDEAVNNFMKTEFDERVFNAFSRIQIGAAKADMFRYAVLLKRGGVYLDVDSDLCRKLDDFILPDDEAIIAPESIGNCFVQWALIFQKNHPFLAKALEMIVENIEKNLFVHDVHSCTGPTLFSNAIRAVIAEQPNVVYRQMPVDYAPLFRFKYRFGRFFLYKNRYSHWKKQQEIKPVYV